MASVRTVPQPPVACPFVYHIRWTLRLVLETLFGALVLAPLRALLILTTIVSVTVIGYIASYGYSGAPGTHIKPWQRKLVKVTFPFLSRLGLVGLGYNWVTVKGKRATFAEAPVTIVGPHSAWADGVALVAYTIGRTLSRAENKHLFMQREVLMSLESIFIDRSKPNQGKILKAHIEAPGAYLPLTGCPEGTTHAGTCLLSFKDGLFRPGLPVQPVVFTFGPHDPGLFKWVHSGAGTLTTIFLGMCQLHNTLSVTYLPVYRPSAEEKANSVLYAKNVQQYMSRHSGLPATHFSLEDANLVWKAMELGLPDYSGTVQFNLMRTWFGFSRQFVEEQLKRFASMNSAKDGLLSEQEFCDYLKWPVTADSQHLFSCINPEKAAGISFAQYLAGLGDLILPLADKAGQESIVDEVFSRMQAEGNGVSIDSAREVFSSESKSPDYGVEDIVSRFAKDPQSSVSSHDAFVSAVNSMPEYRVLFQWLLHGRDSYPQKPQAV